MTSFMSSVDHIEFIIILVPNLELQHWTLFTFQPITILL